MVNQRNTVVPRYPQGTGFRTPVDTKPKKNNLSDDLIRRSYNGEVDSRTSLILFTHT